MAESVGVTEGETVRVCIEVDDRSLLDPSDSPSVRIETAEIESNAAMFTWNTEPGCTLS